MMILQQHAPGLHRLLVARTLSRPPFDHLRTIGGAPKDVRASIQRMLQHRNHVVVSRIMPADAPSCATLVNDRKIKPRFARPQHDLAGATEFAELAEDHSYGLNDPFINVQDNASEVVPAISGRQLIAQLTPLGFRIACCNPSLSKQRQLVTSSSI
jgi:hypothetical protein